MNYFVAFSLVCLCICFVHSKITLPNVISSHMVLTANPLSANIWGWTDNTKSFVNVTISYSKSKSSFECVTPDSTGFFQCAINADASIEPASISVSDNDSTSTITDVLFGYVFLCSGQSNMALPVGSAFNSTDEIADSVNYPYLRTYFADHTHSSTPQRDNGSPYQWAVSQPQYISGFSAVCYFSGRDISRMNPFTAVGLALADVSGTRIEAWTDQDGLPLCGDVIPPGDDVSQLWNGMIYPLHWMTVTSIFWFQGEQNSFYPQNYACRFPLMIERWRGWFNQTLVLKSSFQNSEVYDKKIVERKQVKMDVYKEPIPFFFVLLGPIPYHFGWVELRVAQLGALKVRNTNVINALDCGDANNTANGTFAGPVHFRFKQPVGERLARRFVRDVLNNEDVIADGPILNNIDVSPTQIVINYDLTLESNTYLHTVPSKTCSACCTLAGSPWILVLSDGTNVTGSWSILKNAITVSVPVKINPGVEISAVAMNYVDYPECVLSNSANIPELPYYISLSHRRFQTINSIRRS